MANTDLECRTDGADDFEFCTLSSGGLVLAGADAAVDMCVADEVFSKGKLLPLRPSSDTAADASGLSLSRSESTASTAGLSSRSDSRSGSSSSSSSGSVSRSHSSKSSSPAEHGAAPGRRSLPRNLFYAHPSPSPQLRSRPRRSAGSAATPATWGIIRLGVFGAPDVYPPRTGEVKNSVFARGGGSRSARFEQASSPMDKKHAVGMLGGGFACTCSPDAVEPMRSPEPARRRRRRKGEEEGGVKRGSARGSRILEWLEELSITREKN